MNETATPHYYLLCPKQCVTENPHNNATRQESQFTKGKRKQAQKD